MMRRFFAWVLGAWFATLVVWPLVAKALTAQQVYQNVKDSIYTVYSLNKKNVVQARGSAVAVSKTVLVTNCHVALSGDYLVVQLQDESKRQSGTLFYKNKKEDLCFIEIADANFKPVKIRPSSQVDIGEVVYAIGNPKGTEKTISKGIISNKHKTKGGEWLQTDAMIYFGSSGGGLFDEEGRLIGITSKMGGNFSFALPTEWIISALSSPKSERIIASKKLEDQNNEIVFPEAIRGLSFLGDYGNDKIGLYRNNRECFLLIQGRDTNGNVSSAALWNPKYETTLVIFPTTSIAREAMNIIYTAVSEKQTSKQAAYRSGSVLYIAGQPYSLYGTQKNLKKYPFLVTRFSQSPRPIFLNGRAFKIIFKDDDPGIGNATLVYQLNGVAEALSAYNAKCN